MIHYNISLRGGSCRKLSDPPHIKILITTYMCNEVTSHNLLIYYYTWDNEVTSHNQSDISLHIGNEVTSHNHSDIYLHIDNEVTSHNLPDIWLHAWVIRSHHTFSLIYHYTWGNEVTRHNRSDISLLHE